MKRKKKYVSKDCKYNNDLLIYKISSTCFGQYFAHHQEQNIARNMLG